MKFLPVIFRIIRNKYFLASVFFISWMLFFDHNNLFLHLGYRAELNELKETKKYYQSQIEKTREEVELMKTDPRWMEKVAREQYLMKKEGEDVYLIREK